MKVLLYILSLIIFVSSANADTAWVDDNGAASWGNCQGASPLVGAAACSLATANTNVSAGDFVYMRGGDYSTTIRPGVSGSSGNPITYSRYQSEDVHITNLGTAVDLRERDYIIIDGLRITDINNYAFNMDDGTYGGDFNSGASYCIIRNCSMSADTDRMIFMRDSHYNKIQNNFIRGLCEPSDLISMRRCTYNLIEGNDLSHADHLGITVNGKEGDTGHNIFRNNILSNPWHAVISIYRNATPTLIENNYVLDGGSDYQNNTCGTDRDRTMPLRDHKGIQIGSPYLIIRGNIAVNNGRGIGLSTTEPDKHSQHLRVYNNTFHDNYWGIGSNSSGDIEFNIFKNNIIWDSKDYDIRLGGGSSDDNTLVYNNFGTKYNDNNTYNNNLSIEPLFEDEAGRNFNLTENSPMIDAGGWLTTTTQAGNGNLVPVDDARYFMDGWGIIDGDIVQFENQTATYQVVDVDYDTNTLTLNSSATWSSGLGIALPYVGSKPDMGAFEYNGMVVPPEPTYDPEIVIDDPTTNSTYNTNSSTIVLKGTANDQDGTIASVSGTASSCPPFYADTNVLLSWNGDNALGPEYICNSNGTSIIGFNDSIVLGTSYGEGGSSNGALIDSTGIGLEWIDTGDQYIDDDAAQTVCFRSYIQTVPTSDKITFFESNAGTTADAIQIYVDTNGNMQGKYFASGDGGGATATGTSPTTGDWITVCYSWDKPNDDHSAYPGNPEDENTYDSGGWEDDNDEITTTMSADLNAILLGEDILGDVTNGDIRIDQFVLMSGYKTAPPTNWLTAGTTFSVTCDDGTCDESQEDWTSASISLASGNNYLTVTVTDDASNTGTDNITVVRGTDADPVTTITGPTSDTTYSTTTGSVTVTGTATDADGTVASIAWACPECPTTSGSCTCDTAPCDSASEAFTCGASISLNAGANTITVTTTDNESDTGADTLTVFQGYEGRTEAESATETSPMVEGTDTTVIPAITYVYTPTPNDGDTTLNFSVDTTGDYKFIANVKASSGSANSFFITVDSESQITWHINQEAEAALWGEWYEDEINSGGDTTDPYVVNLTAGAHTLRIDGREDNTWMDYFRPVLTPNPQSDPEATIIEPTEYTSVTVMNPISIKASVTDGGTVQRIHYSMDCGDDNYDIAPTYAATPDDGTYDEATEEYTLDLYSHFGGFLPEGDCAVQLWGEDDGNNTGDIDLLTFTITKKRGGSGSATLR